MPRGGVLKKCSGGDLNPHALRHTPLKRTCLPFHHPSARSGHSLTPVTPLASFLSTDGASAVTFPAPVCQLFSLVGPPNVR